MNNKTRLFIGFVVAICFCGTVLAQVLEDSNYEDCLQSSEFTLEFCVDSRTHHTTGDYKPYSDELMKSIATNNMVCIKEDRIQKENCKSLIVKE